MLSRKTKESTMEKENRGKRRKTSSFGSSLLSSSSSVRLSWADRIGPLAAASRVSLSQASTTSPNSNLSSSSMARKRQRTDSQQQQLWVDRYAPKSADQLCVAPKKAKEVRAWLEEESRGGRGGMLVWVGSPGVGKSTTIRVLASELGWTVLEWTDSYSTQFVRDGRHQVLSVDQTSSLDSFEDFLQQAGVGYAPLSIDSHSKHQTKAVILIDELPNLYSKETEERFRAIMSRHLQQSHVPTVLVFSDVQEGKHKPADLERLVDPGMLYSDAVQIRHCNPVTKARMKKSLEAICKKEGIRVPTGFWEEIHLQSGGDLRHAIMSLQFRGTNQQQTRDHRKHYERDTKLSSFHALGKILYAKRKKDAAPSSAGDDRPPLDFDPEAVVERSDMELGGSLTFLEFHCPDFFSDTSELSDAMAYYSDAAFLLDRTFERSQGDLIFPHGYVASIAGRAAANFNRHPSPMTFRQFSAPKVFEVMRKRRGNELTMQQLCQRLSVGSQQMALDRNLGSCDSFVVNALPYMRQILPQEVDHALGNLYSYVRSNDGYDGKQRAKNEVARLAEEQRQILEMDDIVDDDSSWEETMVPTPRHLPPQSLSEPEKKSSSVVETQPEVIEIDL